MLRFVSLAKRLYVPIIDLFKQKYYKVWRRRVEYVISIYNRSVICAPSRAFLFPS